MTSTQCSHGLGAQIDSRISKESEPPGRGFGATAIIAKALAIGRVGVYRVLEAGH
jgi:hypothetical protein